LRRIRDERRFVWSAFLEFIVGYAQDGIQIDHADVIEISAHMATAACVNGWGIDRVRIILKRAIVDNQLTISTAVKLIKALSHFPLQDPRDYKLVDDIVEMVGTSTSRKNDQSMFHATVEFYCVNKQFKKVSDILVADSVAHSAEDIFETIFRHVGRIGNGNLFYHFHDCMHFRFGIRKYLNQLHADMAIDFALSSASGKRLVESLELIHLTPEVEGKKRISLEGHRRSRVEALAESSDVPIRVRKKIRQFLKFI
jgi:hypothetical protein